MSGEGDGDRYAETNLVFRSHGAGRLTELLPRGGTVTPLVGTSRAAAFGDLDGDGGVDVVVVNRDGPAYLLRNIVPDRGNWVRLRALDRHGRDALGAVLTLSHGDRTVTRVVRAAYSYCASSDPGVHVGLGSSGGLKSVRVDWPDGTTESFGAYDAGRTVVLRQAQPQES